MDENKKNTENLAEGSLMSHLFELRNRLFIIIGSVLIVFLCLVPFSQQLLTFMAEPLTQFIKSEQLQAIKPISPLTAQIYLAFYDLCKKLCS